jgi:hypothetical protein
MNFYFCCHYASGLSFVTAQWLDRVSLVPLFVIIWPCVLFTQRPGSFHTLNELIPFFLKIYRGCGSGIKDHTNNEEEAAGLHMAFGLAAT